MKSLKIFCVGGTIDKIYFDAKSKYEIGAPSISKVLRDHDVVLDYQVVPLMAKDSLEMTEADRAEIVSAVSQAVEDKIVITHGTDTMAATAKELARIRDKTIVLTGALSPAIFKDSDAIFNIGCAIATAQVAQPGVYIAMNGRVFNHNQVRKDVSNNRFVPLWNRSIAHTDTGVRCWISIAANDIRGLS